MKINYAQLIIFLLIFSTLIIGFVFGYSYYFIKGKECQANPFVFGIKEINKINTEDFECLCHSKTNYNKAFSFDKEGINKNPYE